MDKELLKQQAYSFVKTFLTVFIGVAYFADQGGADIFTVSFLILALKASSLSVIRNIYKLLTENS